MDNFGLAAGLLGCCAAGFTTAYVLFSRRIRELEKSLYIRTRKNTQLENELADKCGELRELQKQVSEKNKANVAALEQIQKAIHDVDEQKSLLDQTRAKLFMSFKALTQDSVCAARTLEGSTAKAQITTGGKQPPIVVSPEGQAKKEPDGNTAGESQNGVAGGKDGKKDASGGFESKVTAKPGVEVPKDTKEKNSTQGKAPKEGDDKNTAPGSATAQKTADAKTVQGGKQQTSEDKTAQDGKGKVAESKTAQEKDVPPPAAQPESLLKRKDNKK